MLKRTAFLCAVLALSNPVLAQEPETELPEIVVTASRFEEPQLTTPQEVTVITKQEIERSHATFVTDVLSTQPDLQVVQNGGPGTVATLYMRGGAGNQVLVLVDGVKMNNPTTGSADLSFLQTADIERIEIIKGPQSTVYGSEAMAGVVNIITKKGAGPLQSNLALEEGSFDSERATANVSQSGKSFNYRGTATYFYTDGIPIAKNGSVPNPYSNGSATARIGINPSDRSSVDVNLRYESDVTHLDNYVTGVGPVDTRNYIQYHDNTLVAATGRIFPGDTYEQSLVVSHLLDAFKGTDPVNVFNNYQISTTTDVADWQHILRLQPLTLTGGVAYRTDAANSAGSFNRSVNDSAGYLNGKLGLAGDTLILSAGSRYDDYSSYGGIVTYRAGALYILKSLEMRFKANYGTGFRAPALNELYFPNFGNPKLKPEKSTGYDAGVEKDLFDKKLTVGVSWFWQRYVDLIQTNFNTFTADNIGHALTDGVEVTVSALPAANLKAGLGYTSLVARNEDTGARLDLRPRDKATASVVYSVAKLTLSGECQYVSDRFDSSLNRTLAAYTLVNVKAGYALREGVSLFARIENLFDESYELSAGYGTPGLSGYGGIKMEL